MSATIEATRFCVADIFRAVWPRHTAKCVARAADRSTRTAEGWMQRRGAPSGGLLLRMAAHNPALRAEVVRRMQSTAEDLLAAEDALMLLRRERAECVRAEFKKIEGDRHGDLVFSRVDSRRFSRGNDVDVFAPRSLNWLDR